MRTLVLTCITLLSGSCLAAAEPAASEAQMIERAASLRQQAGELRAHADREQARKQPACNTAFQVNSCLADAREARLVEIRRARALEREAHRLELDVKRRQASIARAATAAGQQSDAGTAAPAVPLRIKARTDQPATTVRRDQKATAQRVSGARKRADQQKNEAAAAHRAEAAKADRDRYDARLLRYEETQAAEKPKD